ncbi:C40 family peptidase [Paenibacillus wynnii]|uniref:C40 family peptidase n=1 Tax=Paenibacillus wynnii TaxID=268407 RepID=UPI00278CFC84|nr:stalk domain-containing protein [Paenibacillus wynnii]MDQ0193517.1 cell wall-associated NlpC family hydrolase [Paenibacillus wynnii]
MTKIKGVLLSLLTMSMLYSASAHAEETKAEAQMTPIAMSIYLDGQRLQPEVEPINLNGTVLVPMNELFKVQGANLSWNNTNKTVTATKGDTTFTYRIGELTANLNDQTLKLTTAGHITNGYTMIPLRFVTEALGNTVKWDPDTRSIQISSVIDYDTAILWGVNLRNLPSSQSASASLEMLAAGSKVHVIDEVDALWIKVRTPDNKIGYLSAKPKYTDYTSSSLIKMQADELITYGKKYLGKPYVFGASPDQTDTFDCSSFVKRVFEDTLSIELPRVSYDQAKIGKEIGINDLRKGDLLFFTARNLEIGHVAIYAGNDQILHTYSKELGVHIESFGSKWKERFVTARRVF